MLNKSQALKDHFRKWQQTHSFEGDFYEDGIIDEQTYSASNIKILFVAKEPNARNHETLGYRSFVDEWRNSIPKYPFAQRIAEWTAGILNNFPPFETFDEDNKHLYLHKIAFMNLKKYGGTGLLSDNRSFRKLVKAQAEFINKQIAIIEPDLIILSVSHDKQITENLFREAGGGWHSSGYQVPVGRFGSSKVINFYHPSARNVPAAAYSLLQNVINSSAFSRL